MPVLLRATLLGLLALGLGTADAQTEKLVGSWKLVIEGSDAVEMAAYDPVLTFGADGTLGMRLTSLDPSEDQPADGRYTVEGDRIVAVIDGDAQPARYWFEKGDLYIDDRGSVLRWRRTNVD